MKLGYKVYCVLIGPDEQIQGPLTKNWFSRPISAKCRSKVLQNAPIEHSAILLTFIKLPFLKTFVLSIFEWPLQTGFTLF